MVGFFINFFGQKVEQGIEGVDSPSKSLSRNIDIYCSAAVIRPWGSSMRQISSFPRTVHPEMPEC